MSESLEAWRDEAMRLRQMIEDARSQLGATGCPLCTYIDGKVTKACALHAEVERLNLQNRALEARVEILSRKPLDTGLDNETWRDGKHCICNFDPNSPKVRAVCQFHETIYKEWAQEKDKVEAMERLNRVLQSELELVEGWLSVQPSVAATGIARRIRETIRNQSVKRKCEEMWGSAPQRVCGEERPCKFHDKRVAPVPKCGPESYHCYNHDREDHGGHTVCCRCGERR